ncbi:MAG TPA: hypothetical protein VFN61_07935 [Acidimicrobiales bacterium]|nr:hypothetical protein [Acidimicrobiales bacterium]
MTRYWRLAKAQHRAFSRGVQRCPLPLWMHILALVTFDWRAHPDGTAVCLLRRRWGATSAVVVLSGVAALVVGATGRAAVFAVAALLAWGAWDVLRCYKQGAARAPVFLGLTYKGGPIYLHGFASCRRGDGAALMRAVVTEADSNGWALALDAPNERLARYYECFGFSAVDVASQRYVHMLRPAAPADPVRREEALRSLRKGGLSCRD